MSNTCSSLTTSNHVWHHQPVESQEELLRLGAIECLVRLSASEDSRTAKSATAALVQLTRTRTAAVVAELARLQAGPLLLHVACSPKVPDDVLVDVLSLLSYGAASSQGTSWRWSALRAVAYPAG